MTLVATPGDALANSYITLREATALLDLRPGTQVWFTADTLDQERALRWATQLLDRMVDWDGTPRYTTQALGWPRYGVMAETELFATPDVIGGGAANNLLFSGATITGPSGSFAAYQANQWLTISGATQTANNGTWQLSSVTDTVLTFAHITFTTENSSPATLTGVTHAETIPEDIRRATAEYALLLYQAACTTTDTSQGALANLRSFADGNLRLEFKDTTVAPEDRLPRPIMRLLHKYGIVAGGGIALLARV